MIFTQSKALLHLPFLLCCSLRYKHTMMNIIRMNVMKDCLNSIVEYCCELYFDYGNWHFFLNCSSSCHLGSISALLIIFNHLKELRTFISETLLCQKKERIDFSDSKIVLWFISNHSMSYAIFIVNQERQLNIPTRRINKPEFTSKYVYLQISSSSSHKISFVLNFL